MDGHCATRSRHREVIMSPIMIKISSFVSILAGCLLPSTPTTLSYAAYISYAINLALTLQFTSAFAFLLATNKSTAVSAVRENNFVSNVFNVRSNLILIIQRGLLMGCHLTTLIACWTHRSVVCRCFEEARKLWRSHGKSTSHLVEYLNASIYSMLIIFSVSILALSRVSATKSWCEVILERSFMFWAENTTLCSEAQFVALAYTVEVATSDINLRIERFSRAIESWEAGGSELTRNNRRSNTLYHPFFQYQEEITPSFCNNICPGLINSRLSAEKRKTKKRDEKDEARTGGTKENGESRRSTCLAGYARYADSTSGSNCQLLPRAEEIRSHREEVSKHFGNTSAAGIAEATSDGIQFTRITIHSKDRGSSFHRSVGCRPAEVGELTRQRFAVSQLARKVSISFRARLAAAQIFAKIDCTLKIYLYVLHLETSTNTFSQGVWMVVFATICQILRLLYVCHRGQRVILQDEETKRKLLALSRSNLSSHLPRDIELFLHQVELWPIKFKVGLNGWIGMPQFFSVGMFMVTSLIILSQFFGLSQ